MNNIPFDLTLDKATERELVYDIVERLSLGKDLTEGTTLYFKAKTKLVDIFKRLILNLPPSLVLHFADIKIGIISISAGQKSGTCRLSGLKEGEIVLAYSEQTQMDIKECISTSGGVDSFICTYTTQVPFIRDEYVKVYCI